VAFYYFFHPKVLWRNVIRIGELCLGSIMFYLRPISMKLSLKNLKKKLGRKLGTKVKQ
jgi:hypothetical protein